MVVAPGRGHVPRPRSVHGFHEVGVMTLLDWAVDVQPGVNPCDSTKVHRHSFIDFDSWA